MLDGVEVNALKSCDMLTAWWCRCTAFNYNYRDTGSFKIKLSLRRWHSATYPKSSLFTFWHFVHSFSEPLIRGDFWNIKLRRKTSELTDFLWHGFRMILSWYYLVQAQIHWGFNSTSPCQKFTSQCSEKMDFLPVWLPPHPDPHILIMVPCVYRNSLCKVLVVDAFDRFCIVSFWDYVFIFY